MTGKRIILCLVLCLCLLLCGCGAADSSTPVEEIEPDAPLKFANFKDKVPADAKELCFVIEENELPMLEHLTKLESADFSGSECVGALYDWAMAHPQVELLYTVTMPDGTVLDNNTRSVDLSKASGEDVRLWAESLKYLSGLKSVELGSERPGLDWDDIGIMQQACPNAKVKYAFELYGKETNTENTQLNMRHVGVYDWHEGAPMLREALDHMPYLSYVDLDSAGIPNEDMVKLQEEYPHINFVWRIWFGSEFNYSVRTDVEMILASKPSDGGWVDEVNSADLKYCTKVKYLDLGHNGALSDISFVRHMPELEVAILAMNQIQDLSPLADCEKLEYLEIQSTRATDLSPLAELKNLRHLNAANIPGLDDISPLYSLTELERLWIGGYSAVPREQFDEMQKRAPKCEICSVGLKDPTEGGWRFKYNEDIDEVCIVPRYVLLRLQFNDYKRSSYAFYWNDPLYYGNYT